MGQIVLNKQCRPGSDNNVATCSIWSGLHCLPLIQQQLTHQQGIVPTSNFQPIRLLDPDCWYKFTYWMANSADPDQLALLQKPTHLYLHCLQRQGIYPGSAGLGFKPLKRQENLHLKMLSVYVVCWIFLQTFQTYFCIQAKSVDPDQTAPRVWSESTLFAKMTFKITSRGHRRWQLLWLAV